MALNLLMGRQARRIPHAEYLNVLLDEIAQEISELGFSSAGRIINQPKYSDLKKFNVSSLDIIERIENIMLNNLEKENTNLKTQLNDANNLIARMSLELMKNNIPIKNVQDDQEKMDQKIIDELTLMGVVVHRVPSNIYPGMPYVIGHDLVTSGATKYTDSRLSRIVEDLGAIRLARFIMYPIHAVVRLREKEAKRDSGELKLGRIPGVRKSAGGWMRPRSGGIPTI